jgi:methyl-accepting chemotaxis protein
MSDRLDRLEKIVESNSRAIEALTNESAEYRQQTTAAIGRLTSISEQLAQLITTLAARQ